jgi:hypothetical protein
MRCPRTMTGPGDLWAPRFLLGVGAPFDHVGTLRKVVMYRDYPLEIYEWHTWTGVEGVCVMCIRFALQGVHRFESPRLSGMSNCFSCDCHQVVNCWNDGFVGIINFALL